MQMSCSSFIGYSKKTNHAGDLTNIIKRRFIASSQFFSTSNFYIYIKKKKRAMFQTVAFPFFFSICHQHILLVSLNINSFFFLSVLFTFFMRRQS